MTNKTKRIIVSIPILLLAAAGFGMAAALQRNTLVDWWKPLAACLPLACVAGRLLLRAVAYLTGFRSRMLGFAIGSALSLSVILGGAYALNFYSSRHSTALTVEAHVTGKYTEERRYTRRVGRHGSVRTEKRMVYNVVITLPDSRSKTFEVSPGEYAKVRRGSSLPLQIEAGYLGMPVIKNLRLPITNHNKNTK